MRFLYEDRASILYQTASVAGIGQRMQHREILHFWHRRRRVIFGLALAPTFALTSLAMKGELRAASISGSLYRSPATGDGLFLRFDEATRGIAIDAEADVQRILRSLKTGSRIGGTGEFRSGRLHLDSVQTVGLRELIGAWKTEGSEIFEFRDFKLLARYEPVQVAGETKIEFRETLNYVLTPDKEHLFSIFLTDSRKSMLVGTLEFVSSSRFVLLKLYDSQSGLETQNLSLSPLFLK